MLPYTLLSDNDRQTVMKTITTTEDLAAFCQKAAAHPYVTVDTEFLRERTYYSKLCLVQLAVPGDAEDDAVLVDPLAGELSLASAISSLDWVSSHEQYGRNR